MRKRREPRQTSAPWGPLLWRRWERVDNHPVDCVVGADHRGIFTELVHRYSGHPLECWWEPLSVSHWMTNREVWIMAKSRLAEVLARAKASGLGQPATDEAFGVEYPILYALMTETSTDGKTKRQTSSVTLFTQDGMWKACVVEKDADVSLFGSADTFLGALANLEARLDAPIVDWRDRAPRGKKK
jgi:hypothetical protein